jgi:hypothetical protein
MTISFGLVKFKDKALCMKGGMLKFKWDMDLLWIFKVVLLEFLLYHKKTNYAWINKFSSSFSDLETILQLWYHYDLIS